MMAQKHLLDLLNSWPWQLLADPVVCQHQITIRENAEQ